ncbi:endoplasmic reticulum chaperone BiP-like [Coffea eugenioides]|uniref:endoplasmic reticulum chaperone BiP-like n=1 Tax=Coffea eugenioides TaxID=49369 RepID=UPI000F6058B0|nr:endoplasmic reticulum chaperone BiP-like [Coffea eugenioides]
MTSLSIAADHEPQIHNKNVGRIMIRMDLSKKNVIRPLKQAVKIKGSEQKLTAMKLCSLEERTVIFLRHYIGTGIHYIGTGINPLQPRGVPQIGVTFEIDTNGLLHVIAEDKATKKSQFIVFNGNRLHSKEEAERVINEGLTLVGNVAFSGTPPALRGAPKVEVTSDVDSNGPLHVIAEDKATNNSESITMDKWWMVKLDESTEEDRKMLEKFRNSYEQR